MKALRPQSARPLSRPALSFAARSGAVRPATASRARPLSAVSRVPRGPRGTIGSPPRAASPPPLHPEQKREAQQALQTLESLQGCFSSLVAENDDLRTSRTQAENKLHDVMSRPEGRLRAEVLEQRRCIDQLTGHVEGLETCNQGQTARIRHLRLLLKEKDFHKRFYEKEAEQMREVAVRLQRDALSQGENPILSNLKRRIANLSGKYGEIVSKMKERNEQQEVDMQQLQGRFQNIDDTVKELWKMTNMLVTQREEAQKFLSFGKQKLHELQVMQKNVRKEVAKQRREMDEVVDSVTNLVEQRQKDVKKIDSLQRGYKETLEELVGNNKWYKQCNMELEKENERLREENRLLMDSLMSYLLLNQKAERLHGTVLEESLGPLCPKATRLRVKTEAELAADAPPQNVSAGVEDADSAEPAPRQKTLAEKTYPVLDAQSATFPVEEEAPLFESKEDAFRHFRTRVPQILDDCGLEL